MVGPTEAGKQTAAAIRAEAASMFASHGYEATSLRAVASKVGITVASLYNHIDSKEDLLLQIMGSTMDDLLSDVQEATARAEDPVERLILLLECHFRFHAERAQAVFIGNSELRALPPEFREEITEKRRRYRALIEELIQAIVADGRGSILDSRLHAFSIVALGTHLAGWYRPTGEYTLDRIVLIYCQMILRELVVPDGDAEVERVLTLTRSVLAR